MSRIRRRPRLRTVLLAVNILILLLPLGGIAALRLYENELIRSTEAQLIAQGLVVREMFRVGYLRAEMPTTSVAPPATIPSAPRNIEPSDVLLPVLDISRDAVLPPAPPAAPAIAPPDPVAVVAGAAMTEALETVARASLAGIRIVDRTGIVVATSGSELGLSLSNREEVGRALGHQRVSLLRRRVSDQPSPPLASVSRGQRYRVFVALPVEDGNRLLGAVVASRTPLDITKALYINRTPILIGAAGILGVVVVVSILTAVTIARPTRALIEQADRVARGERGAVVGIDTIGTEEMARLSRAIASMARTLQDREEYIRAFASHVSHEFKTPLATIRGTVELLQDHLGTMTQDERNRFLGIVEESAERLERLVRRLLDLARADMLAPGDARTDVAGTLARVVEAHRERGLDVQVECDASAGTIRMSEETFGEIVSNLLDNARLHGGTGVQVRITARVDRSVSPPKLELIVTDTGQGISEANADRIFTPFFTTARDRGGSGLGLIIVRSLLSAYGGTIRLEKGGGGATFVVRIPA